MKNTPVRLSLACFLAAVAPVSLSAAANEKTFSIDPTAAWLKTSSGDADMAGIGGTAQFHIGELFVFDASLRGSYAYLTSTDSTDIERQDSDVDLVLSGSLLGFLVPYVTAGVSYDKTDAVTYSGSSDWDAGLALGAGVEITVIPKLLSVTPAIRYVEAEHTDTVTYSLDAQFHLSLIALGARASYEDNLSRDGDYTTVAAYASFRF